MRSPRAVRSASSVSFGDATLKCKDLETFDFSKVDFCLMSAGGTVSKEWSPRIAAKGCVVIDNSSAWRYDQDVPLIVPEVNADAVAGYKKKNIIANPNCSTAQLVVALKPLHDRATDQARGGRDLSVRLRRRQGRHGRAVEPDQGQVRAGPGVEPKKFPKEIAFNCIPHVDVFMEDGYTREEWKMVAETKKILDPKIKVTATCVRVPVFVGHSEAVNIEFEKPITAEEARDILREAPGCLVIDKHEPGGYITPIEAAGEDATYISRIREDGDRRERPCHVDRLGQPAQGRGAQCRADRRGADQSQAAAQGGVTGHLGSRARDPSITWHCSGVRTRPSAARTTCAV